MTTHPDPAREEANFIPVPESVLTKTVEYLQEIGSLLTVLGDPGNAIIAHQCAAAFLKLVVVHHKEAHHD